MTDASVPIAGRNPVLEALRGAREVTHVYVSETARPDATLAEITKLAAAQGARVQTAPALKLDRLARGTIHQGVVAIAAGLPYGDLAAIVAAVKARGEDPFIILLDHVEDPHNLGAVLRVADGAGAHAVVVPERGAVGLTPGVLKASAGAAEHVPVCQVVNLMDAITLLKRNEVWVGGAEAGAGKPFDQERLTGPLAIVMGGEDRGLSRPVVKHCDFLIHLPLAGHVNSLNVATATAVLAFERVRQVRAAKT